MTQPGASIAWHHQPTDDVIRELQTDAHHGLTDQQAAERLARYGRNEITRRQGHGALVRFLLQFHQPLIYILLAATVVTLLLEEYLDAAVIFGVVLVNAVIGFIQESKAITAIEALARSLVMEATVVRGGERERLPAADLVPGDLVLLQSGDRVPADLRLLRVRDLRIAEAALTGESVPCEKHVTTLPVETPLADRENMAYASTLVTFGSGAGVVTATGDATEVGRISGLIAAADDLATPLTRRIAEFSKLLLVLILGLAAANFIIGLIRGQNWVEMFMASVALSVAAIPEGLPAAVTIVLAIGVSRMAQRRAVIRKLPAVETLGSTDVICSDKTGTLTQNQMTVSVIYAAGDVVYVSGGGYMPQGQFHRGQPDGPVLEASQIRGHAALYETLLAGLLCNDAKLTFEQDQWKIEGDPTEAALIVAAEKAGLKEEVENDRWPRVDVIPFESEHQYMATLHPAETGRVIYIKGSLEALLPRCTSALGADGSQQLLDSSGIQKQAEVLAGQGLRVLALARKVVPAEQESLQHADVAGGLEFLGLQAMIDPPRDEAIGAIRTCQTAGIRVKMITGDHAATAGAIARQLGLIGDRDNRVVTGKELQECPDAELPHLVRTVHVFARVAPEQKHRLVKALQHEGHVVAMTGDGVNDAPALKQADIGVAMGLGGTDVARESADMVLTDDNFATIEAAVEEGRCVLDNLTKFIVWTLPTNVGEGLVILLAVLLGATMPMTPVQILWINMTTAVMLGLMLAWEPKEAGIMTRPPRDPRAPLLNWNLVKRIGFVSMLLLAGAYGLFRWKYTMSGDTVDEARTVAVNVFVIGELFYLFNCRCLSRSVLAIGLFTNIPALLGALGMIVLQLLLTYSPLMNRLFGTAPISGLAWLAIFGFGLLLFILVEVEKRLVGHVLQGTARGAN